MEVTLAVPKDFFFFKDEQLERWSSNFFGFPSGLSCDETTNDLQSVKQYYKHNKRRLTPKPYSNLIFLQFLFREKKNLEDLY